MNIKIEKPQAPYVSLPQIVSSKQNTFNSVCLDHRYLIEGDTASAT